MAWLWKLFPLGRVTAAWWAWRNRRELGRWIRFAWRAVPPSAADRRDLLAEARLRAALAREARTRGARSLAVRVRDRTAILEGSLPAEAHDLAFSIARGTKGVLHVDCAILDRGRRSRPHTHAHRAAALPLPPPPPVHPSVPSIS